MDKQEKLIEWLTEAAQKGGAFIESEAPQYAAEVVALWFWTGIAGTITGLVMLSVAVMLFRWAGEMNEHRGCGNGYHAPEKIAAHFFGGVILSIAGMLFFGSGVHNTIVSVVAPRVVIVESLK